MRAVPGIDVTEGQIPIAFQLITIRWSKDQRGAEGGGRRAALPRRLPFTSPADPSCDWRHLVELDAADRYTPREQWRRGAPEQRDGFLVKIQDGGAKILLVKEGGLLLQKASRPRLGPIIARLPFGSVSPIASKARSTATSSANISDTRPTLVCLTKRPSTFRSIEASTRTILF
jgi:hypothetical protein